MGGKTNLVHARLALSCRERNCEKCRDWCRLPPWNLDGGTTMSCCTVVFCPCGDSSYKRGWGEEEWRHHGHIPLSRSETRGSFAGWASTCERDSGAQERYPGSKTYFISENIKFFQTSSRKVAPLSPKNVIRGPKENLYSENYKSFQAPEYSRDWANFRFGRFLWIGPIDIPGDRSVSGCPNPKGNFYSEFIYYR